MEEYEVLYWAAACLANWAGCGCRNVTKLQLASAVEMICNEARLTPAQETMLKKFLNKIMGENDEPAGRGKKGNRKPKRASRGRAGKAQKEKGKARNVKGRP